VKRGLVPQHWNENYVRECVLKFSHVLFDLVSHSNFLIFHLSSLKGDEIQTVDDLLLNKINNGDDVYEVTYKPPLALDDSVLGRLLQPASSTTNDGPFRAVIRWLVQAVVSEVQSEFISSAGNLESLRQPIENRYMAVDGTSDRVRSQMD
jgi:hypothetical protein